MRTEAHVEEKPAPKHRKTAGERRQEAFSARYEREQKVREDLENVPREWFVWINGVPTGDRIGTPTSIARDCNGTYKRITRDRIRYWREGDEVPTHLYLEAAVPAAILPDVPCACGELSVITYRAPTMNGDLGPPEKLCPACYKARVMAVVAAIGVRCTLYDLETPQRVKDSGTDLDGETLVITRTRISTFKMPGVVGGTRDYVEEARRREWNTPDAEALARHRVG
jgi:hypothetical protein